MPDVLETHDNSTGTGIVNPSDSLLLTPYK